MIRGFIWSWVPWIYNKMSHIVYTTKRVMLSTYKETTSEKEWIILKNTAIPLYSLVFTNIPNHSIKWRCKLHPPRFIGPDMETNEYNHVSYLGLSISIPGCDTIDLTNWINEIQWSGILQPNPYDIFALWCCESGISYFHAIGNAKVEIITDTGESIHKGLNDYVHSSYSINV